MNGGPQAANGRDKEYLYGWRFKFLNGGGGVVARTGDGARGGRGRRCDVAAQGCANTGWESLGAISAIWNHLVPNCICLMGQLTTQLIS